MMEQLSKERKEEKTINDLLAKLPESTYADVNDIERIINLEQDAFRANYSILTNFIQNVKSECVMQQYYFSFFNIPEMLVKKRTSKKDFELIQKILLKIKQKYLVQKALLFPDRPIEQLSLTDEDMVPMELLDDVLGAYRHKIQSKFQLWKDLVDSAKFETAKKVKQSGIESEKAKKLIESSVYIHYMAQRLDDKHKAYFKLLYTHE